MHRKVSLKTLERIQRFYAHPRLYECIFRGALNPGRRAAIALLPPKRPLRILEIGIGSGLSLPHYPTGVEVTGIDPSPEMLTVAQKKLAQASAHITLLKMDGAHLTFPPSSFDMTIFLYVLSAAPDPCGLLREAHRVLRPGGIAIIVNHFQGDIALLRRLTFLTKHIGYHTTMCLEDVLESPGWDILRNERAGIARLLVLRKV